MNSNTYSITAYSIPCNTNSYYSVIIIIVYQTYPKVKEMKIWKPYMLRPMWQEEIQKEIGFRES